MHHFGKDCFLESVNYFFLMSMSQESMKGKRICDINNYDFQLGKGKCKMNTEVLYNYDK